MKRAGIGRSTFYCLDSHSTGDGRYAGDDNEDTVDYKSTELMGLTNSLWWWGRRYKLKQFSQVY